MKRKAPRRLPAVPTLYQMLPKGVDGGKEFARLVDLLLFHEGRRSNRKVGLFSDVAGDYHGLDSFAGDVFRKAGTTGYQYKFFPSPLSNEHRKAIVDSLERTISSQKQLELKKWILVTPENLIESARRRDGGDVSWFEGLRKRLGLTFELEHWGHSQLLGLFLETRSLCLFYYPELVADGVGRRKTIQETRALYDENLIKLYREIQFVGMNVRKQEATKGVPMEHIYIPLSVVPEGADEQDPNINRSNPESLLARNSRAVILGDPGSGKSTLLRFLTLQGISQSLQERYQVSPDQRLPIYIQLRRFADELKTRTNVSLIKYIQEVIQSDLNLNSADIEFFEYYLESGQAVLLFDGLDELPSSHFKERVKDQIRTLITSYPGNTTLVTSRIVGYDNPFRFDEKEFSHYRLAKLRFPEIKQFIEDWYRVRIENETDRADHVISLTRILENPEHKAIFDLAENPLLLTIIALVHRIDGVLPDARVVLYKICTETLLESWHRWKFRDLETKNRGREERRNKQRMEGIANWMQIRSVGSTKTHRAVVPFAELSSFLASFISNNEKRSDQDDDPQDAANEFLRFVKERAGLLIEVGDDQYSFVHLTFQEYLTAAYIKTTSELNGIANTWKTIQEIYFEPRWHEVIRLLIAGLDSNASQQFLVEQILRDETSDKQWAKAQLLGGLLLDGVEAAEENAGAILEELLNASRNTHDIEQLRATNSILNSWLTKGTSNEDLLLNLLVSFNKVQNTADRLRTVLVATAIGFSKDKQLRLATELLNTEDSESELFYLFFNNKPLSKTSPALARRIAPLWALQDFYSLTSAELNFIAASCQSVTGYMDIRTCAKRLFEEQLVVLFGGSVAGSGPLGDFIANSCLFIRNAPDILRFLSTRADELNRYQFPRALTLFRATHAARGGKEVDDNNSVIEQAKVHARSLLPTIDIQKVNVRLVTGYRLEDFGSELFSDPSIYTSILQVICDAVRLESRAQWWEALRVDFIPRIHLRIPQLDKNYWSKVEASFSRTAVNETKEFIAAWLLIFDAWLYIHESYNYPTDSPFKNLANLTKDSDAAPLNIAHCIRDLAFGDETRNVDLINMVRSSDRKFQSIFENCYVGKLPIKKSASFPTKKTTIARKK
ncbi:MAG TPA: NACHT domain-containing protein [Pyrinomonadaceae bacterium]